MKYVLLIYGNEAAMQAASKEETDRMHAAYMAYTEAMKNAGVIAGGERLRPSSSGTTVRVTDGKTNRIWHLLRGNFKEAATELRRLHANRIEPKRSVLWPALRAS